MAYGYTPRSFDITKPSSFRGPADSSQGAGGAVGTRYTATLVERPNTSIGNQDMPGRPEQPAMAMPIARMTARNTGRVAG